MPVQRRGGNEARGKTRRFLGERQRRLRFARRALFRQRRLQHRAQAIGGGLVDQLGRGIGLHRRQRAGPIAARRAVVEHRLARPGKRRVFVRQGGIIQRGLVVAAPARLHMQAAQAERMSVAAVQHIPERRFRARAIARQLRRLRAQQPRHRLRADQPMRLGGMAARRARVARADRDHAVRQSRKTLLAPARPVGERDERGNSKDEADKPPDQADGDRQRDHTAGCDHQRGFDAISLPRKADLAGMIGKPRQPEGGQAKQREKQQQANHLVSRQRSSAKARRGQDPESGKEHAKINADRRLQFFAAARRVIASSRMFWAALSAASRD
jgi:hypothetical protein